jgi:hypothetical protein
VDDPKEAPPEYLSLRVLALKKLGFPNERRAILFAVDGRDGAGKSAVASWLAWQLGMPAIQLDLYLLQGSPVRWRIDELRAALNARIKNEKPVIVEGVAVLKALQQTNLKSDFLVFVENTGFDGSHGLGGEIANYFSEYRPQQAADFVLSWPGY